MKSRHVLAALLPALAALAALLAGPAPASAAKKAYEDKRLGYRLRLEDSFVQNPPGLTPETAFLVGEWYEDSAKYDAPGLRPTFQVMWFVEPKQERFAPPPPGPGDAEGAAPPAGPATPGGPGGGEPGKGGAGKDEGGDKADRKPPRIKDFDDAMDRLLARAVSYFGPPVPMKDHWAEAEKDRTGTKIPVEWFELNEPTRKKPKKGDPKYAAYGFVARLTLDRPKERIHVGFFAYCSVDWAKKYQKDFPAIVRSFGELRTATDSRNEGAQASLSQDPEERYQQILKYKLAAGWKADRTDHYILIYHEDVDRKLVRQIGEQIEAIRAQVYEVLFPPDRPITAFSIVRVCKDPDQYGEYGGPGGSAGYWNDQAEELVFYDGFKDSLRVLYHEAFHQYIFYSVGDLAPHSWFNEGHGDYFAGHDYRAGKFVRGPFDWRIAPAREWKKNPKRPPLKEWLQWTQREYYGGNKAGVPPGANYALGWSFVWFLRTTKKPEYQGILERYFDSLKGSMTAARALEDAFQKQLDDWEKKLEKNPDLPKPERKKDEYAVDPLKTAMDVAFQGIDWDQIEKDWLAADY